MNDIMEKPNGHMETIHETLHEYSSYSVNETQNKFDSFLFQSKELEDEI